MDEPAIDEEEAEPRFLLVGSEPLPADAVAAVLAALQPAAMIVSRGSGDRFSEIARDHGVAILAKDDLDLALEADGIHLTDPGRVAEIRSTLDRRPEDRLILGADVGLSRHDAMVAGEEGADYIGFGEPDRSAGDEILELVAWWRSTTILPCLAYAADAETVAKLARINTDFIGVGTVIWDHRDSPAVAARELRAAVEKT